MHSRPYAEATQRVVDSEVAPLLREAKQRVRELLDEHRDKLHSQQHGQIARSEIQA